MTVVEIAEVLYRTDDGGIVFRAVDGAVYSRGTVTAADGTVVHQSALLYEAKPPPETLTAEEARKRQYREVMAGLMGPNVLARLRPPTPAESDAAEEARFRPPPVPVPAGPSAVDLEERRREEAFIELGRATRRGERPPVTPAPQPLTMADLDYADAMRGKAAERARRAAEQWDKSR